MLEIKSVGFFGTTINNENNAILITQGLRNGKRSALANSMEVKNSIMNGRFYIKKYFFIIVFSRNIIA